MTSPLGSIAFWSLLTTAVNLAGIYLVRLWPDQTRARVLTFTAFGGGVVLGAALLHLLPEAIHHRADAGLYAVIAFLFLYFIESHVRYRHSGGLVHATAHGSWAAAAPRSEARVVALMTALAFALHSISDGIALAVTFRDVSRLGAATGLAVLAHEAPEGIAVFSLLLYGGLRARAALAYAWFVALITPAVAFLAYFTVGDLAESTLGALLGLVAGSFLYIGASDILPEIRRSPHIKTSLAILGGLTVPIALLFAGM